MTFSAAPVDSLEMPLYGASLGQAFTRFWKKYATFSGRASRSEYWWLFLVGFVVSAATQIISTVATGSFTASVQDTTDVGDVISYIWSLATLVPSLALSWRRLHDINRTGLWNLIALVPIVGWIVLLVFYLSGPDPGGARFDR